MRVVVGWRAAAALAVCGILLVVGCERPGRETAGSGRRGELGTGVLAQVGDARLTEADLQRLIPSELRESITGTEIREILDRWVRTELLYQRARSEGIESDAAVAARLHEMQRDFLADELLQRELTERVRIGNEELQAYYQKRRAEYTQELQLKHILVDTREEAEEILAMLRNGAVFEDLARSRSRDATASSGGDLGFLGKSAMNPAFEARVFDAAPGQSVGPIATTFGFHVVKVAARRPATEPLSFDAARDEILHSLLLEKQQAAQEQLIDELRRGTAVQIATSYAGMALEPAPKGGEEPRWSPRRGSGFGSEGNAGDSLGTVSQ
jgi:peptidyl-prolyl cis-trans isomerase C